MHFSGDATAGSTVLPGTNTGNVGQTTLIPHFYGVTDIDDRTKFGLALTVPFADAVKYADDWSGRYLNIKTVAQTLDINPNISYRVADWLSVGGGLSLQYLRLELSSAIAQSLILGPGTPDGGYLLDAHHWDLGYNLGFLAEPIEGTRLGVAYRSGVDHKTRGSLDFTPATSPFLGLVNAPVSAGVDLPASITASLTQRVSDGLSLSSDVQFTHWSVFKQVSLVAPPNPTFTFAQGYRDSWMGSLGGVYQLNEIWRLRAGAGYDESPVVDAYRDTGVPDAGRIMLALGTGTRLGEGLWIDVGYVHYMEPGRANMNSSVNAVDPIAGTVLHGSYNNSLDDVVVSFRGTF
jgi:long-chain fatty acid transport protein